jgi:TonB family protein
MTSPLLTETWRRRRWVLAVALVFFAQVGLIFWLGEKKPASPRPPAPAPVLQLASRYDPEFLALIDPSLLALPHPQGFSGLAWLNPRPLEPASFDWSEEPRWLQLATNRLGADFSRIVQGDFALSGSAAAAPEPEFGAPFLEPLFRPDTPSRLTVYGALSDWRFVTPFELPAWPPRQASATDPDLLTNTVVQLLINADGRPLSATVLSSSGSAAADAFALVQLRSARLEPPDSSGQVPPEAGLLNQLLWGRFVFEWRTLPGTNAPPGAS